MADLNDLIPPGSGWLLEVAAAINDAGQITGTGTVNGCTHAFLLTPERSPARGDHREGAAPLDWSAVLFTGEVSLTQPGRERRSASPVAASAKEVPEL